MSDSCALNSLFATYTQTASGLRMISYLVGETFLFFVGYDAKRAWFQPKFLPKCTDHGWKNASIIKCNSMLITTRENCFYIVDLYFRAHFHNLWTCGPILPSVFFLYMLNMFKYRKVTSRWVVLLSLSMNFATLYDNISSNIFCRIF